MMFKLQKVMFPREGKAPLARWLVVRVEATGTTSTVKTCKRAAEAAVLVRLYNGQAAYGHSHRRF